MRGVAALASVTALGATVLGVTVLLRYRHTRRQRLRSPGVGPGVRTDDGVLLHVETDDPTGADLTVVLCHGFASREQVFRHQRDVLRRRARLILFDQRGHHDSGWAGHRSVTMDRLAQDLEAVVQRCAGPRPVVLVGHSLGALTILALAGRRPDLFGTTVVGVGLLSGTATGPLHALLPKGAASRPAVTRAADALAWPLWLLAPIVDLLRPASHRLGRWVLRDRMYGTDPVPRQAMDMVRQAWLDTSQAKVAALLPALLRFDAEEALPVVGRVPTLVLAGTQDATVPSSHGRRMAAAIGPSARCRLVPGAGHMVPVTHPETVNRELLALLTMVAPADAEDRA